MKNLTLVLTATSLDFNPIVLSAYEASSDILDKNINTIESLKNKEFENFRNKEQIDSEFTKYGIGPDYIVQENNTEFSANKYITNNDKYQYIQTHTTIEHIKAQTEYDENGEYVYLLVYIESGTTLSINVEYSGSFDMASSALVALKDEYDGDVQSIENGFYVILPFYDSIHYKIIKAYINH